MIPKPLSHKILSSKPKTNIIQNLKNAVLYNPLNVSINICVSEKQI